MQTMFPELETGYDVGRFPYRYSSTDAVTGIKVFFDPGVHHILVEISGRGCNALSEKNQIVAVLVAVGNRCSRVDVSADIHTDQSPLDFVRAGHSARFKSVSTHVSASGETVYIGSLKSDRHAAVYKYNEPHPRSHLLRIEHRYRGDRAKDMAKYIGEHGIVAALNVSGEAFGWQSELWTPSDLSPVPLPRVSVDAKDSNVARWLLTQVFPAMRKYERLGQIDDLRAFVETYLFDDDQE